MIIIRNLENSNGEAVFAYGDFHTRDAHTFNLDHFAIVKLRIFMQIQNFDQLESRNLKTDAQNSQESVRKIFKIHSRCLFHISSLSLLRK